MDEVKNLVNHLFPEEGSKQVTTENVKFFLATKDVTTAQIANQMTLALNNSTENSSTTSNEFDDFLRITNIEDLLIKQ